jgi:hypothetical protein
MQNLKRNIVNKLQWLAPQSDVTKNSSKRMLIIASLLIFFLAQAIAWIQINGQFIWPWMKDHMLAVSLLGIPISYLLMLATNYAYVGMDGKIWPGRLLAFAMGILVFTIFTAIFLKEGMTLKTVISLILSFILIGLQLV